MKEFKRSLLVFAVMSVITGFVYPLIITGVAQVAFPQKAQGSLLNGPEKTVGSALIGQQFTSPKYFHGRPSALEHPYDAGNSGGSNAAPSNAKFLEDVGKRIVEVRKDNGLDPAAPVPADLVLASGSGLDPHISLEAALVQVSRVAKARSLPEAAVQDLVQKQVEEPLFGFLGWRRVNVLLLNLALDQR